MSRVLLALLGAGLLIPACAPKAPPPPPPEVPAPAPDPEAWRAVRPAPGPERPWEAPSATVFTLSNGVEVALVENHTLPLVTVQVLVDAGRLANPRGKAGLHALTASMLDEGTKGRTGAQLAAALAAQGAELSVWGGGDGSGVWMNALGGEALAPSLDLLTEVLLQPRFDKADFARVKQQTLDQLAADRAEPRTVATRTFSRELFGADHPLGTAPVGDEATVKGLTLADAQAFYKTWWHAGNARLVVVGDVTQAELQALLEPRLGRWARGKATRPAPVAPAERAQTELLFVEQPGAVQSVIVVGRVAMGRTDPEFWPAYLAGTLVGGMFGSRLNMNLREEHGWSYGAYGGFSEDRGLGVFSARASVQADKTAPAVTEILKELEAARRPPTAEELQLTRDYLARSLPGNFETNASTAASFAASFTLGLGPDAWRRYTTELLAPDAAAVGAAATRWLDPAKMLIVVVGPRTVEVEEGGQKRTVDVQAELAALGFPTPG